MTKHGGLTHRGKADFNDIYTAPDPRPYFATLGPLEYQMPEVAAPVVEQVLALRDADRSPTVLDLCCSYGMISALLHSTGAERLAARYTDSRVADLDSDEMAAADRARFCRERDFSVVGLDVSAPAIAYGRHAGLLADGWAEDLEDGDPSPELATGLRDVDLVVCTGGVGYIGTPTFRRILDATARPEQLWLVVFVLRVFDYAPIRELLTTYGLETVALPGTFRQRRFADDAEREAALADVRRRGLDPTGKEADGWYHATGFVSAPASAADQLATLGAR
jgi:SAM-dependent methyltransferase